MMKNLDETELFRSLSPEETEKLLQKLNAVPRLYQKGEILLHMGDTVSSVGVILSGSVRMEAVDAWGKRTVLGHAREGEVFAETYALLPEEPLLVDVVAARDSSILFLNVAALLALQDLSGSRVLIRNYLAITARKNLGLSRRIFYTTPRTIRERLLLYLSDQARMAGSATFQIPFDRQQLADFLHVERSALSAEIGRMGRDGLITAKGRCFTLLG